MLCLWPQLVGSPFLLAGVVFESLGDRLLSGLLWRVPGLSRVEEREGRWFVTGPGEALLEGDVSVCLRRLKEAYSIGSPISVHTPYSLDERPQDGGDGYDELYLRAAEVSVLSGLFGTLHNNQFIDNYPWEVRYEDTALSKVGCQQMMRQGYCAVRIRLTPKRLGRPEG